MSTYYENTMVNKFDKNFVEEMTGWGESTLSKNPNLRSFKTILGLIYDLKKKDLIDKKQFEELITYSCSIFVENLIEEKITKTFTNSLLKRSHKILEHA